MSEPQLPFDSRCEATFMDDTGWHLTQCPRNGKYKEGGKHWCKQHLPSAKAVREEEASRRWHEKQEARLRPYRRAALVPQLLAALEDISTMAKAEDCNQAALAALAAAKGEADSDAATAIEEAMR